jgi:UPF0716 protein FxsA
VRGPVRGRVPWGLVAALFVVVPLVEIYLILQAGQVIGVGWTVLVLVLDSLLGAFLLKREGSAAWRALTGALASYRMPARELADGALVLVGGTLLLTPGFFTDGLGFFFILPFTRPIARKALTSLITRKFLRGPGGGAGFGPGREGRDGPSGARTRRSPGSDSVIRGDVVD